MRRVWRESEGSRQLNAARRTPGAFEESIRNLKEISPVDYANESTAGLARVCNSRTSSSSFKRSS